MLSLRRELTSWLLRVAVEVEEDLDRMSPDRMISSAYANRILPVLPACTWMTLLRPSLKTLRPLWGCCLLNGFQKAPPNRQPEGCSLVTEAELPSTAKLAFSLHHNLKVYCCQVCTFRYALTFFEMVVFCFSDRFGLCSYRTCSLGSCFCIDIGLNCLCAYKPLG